MTTLVGCTWTVDNTNSWITIGSALNNTNSGVVTFSVASNGTAFSRSGAATIAGQAYAVTQGGAACTYTVSATGTNFGPTGASGSVNVTTLVGCTWTVENTNSWITIGSALSNTNTGVVTFSVASNGTALSRSGVLTIAGQAYAVTQAGAACTYTLSATSTNFGPAAANGTVNVTTLVGCTWTVDNTNGWITIDSPLSNTNSGVITFSVASNGTALSRSGVLSVAGQVFTITQNGDDCTYLLSATSTNFGPTAASGNVNVTTLVGCTWTVDNTNSWITIGSALSNTNSGVVTFSVASNSTALSRSGVLSVAGQSFAVTQNGDDCTYSLSATGTNFGPTAASGSLNVTTLVGCTWTVNNTNSWIVLNSAVNNTNSGVVTFSVASNSTALSRSGVLTIAGQAYAVTQGGAACTYTLSATNTNFGPAAGNGTVNVNTLVGCT